MKSRTLRSVETCASVDVVQMLASLDNQANQVAVLQTRFGMRLHWVGAGPSEAHGISCRVGSFSSSLPLRAISVALALNIAPLLRDPHGDIAFYRKG